jgi:hypothetical protein
MPSKILGNISLDTYNLNPDINYLNSITKLPEEYDEFGQGYWKNLSLYNATGNCDDTQYRNTKQCKPTEYVRNCVQIQRFLLENFKLDNLKMVRARSLVDGLVIPHRDFVELDKSITYFRIFVPLENNHDSYHSDEAGVFQMKSGEVWFLDAGINHAAVNFGGHSRMFLCLDFMFEGPFEESEIFSDNARLTAARAKFHIDRKPLMDEERSDIIRASAQILSRHTFKDLVFALSKYHFSYDTPVSSCYDWMISAAMLTRDQKIIDKATSLRRYLIDQRAMGERFTINDWSV